MRRTKIEAAETRTHILLAAEEMFLAEGVTRSSLDKIADAAGVTRGAIYHHFKDKYEIFEALYEAAQLPLEEMITQSLSANVSDPLGVLERTLVDCIVTVTQDPRRQRLCEIMMSRCEYVGVLKKVQVRQREVNERMHAVLSRGLKLARDRGQHTWEPKLAATTLSCLMSGIFANWFVWGEGGDESHDIRRYELTVKAVFASLRASAERPHMAEANRPRRSRD